MAASHAQNPEENLRNSIFSVDVSKSPRSVPVRKGTAFAVNTEGLAGRVVLVTSQKAVDGGQMTCTRFCADPFDYQDDHLPKDSSEPRFYMEQFCFIPLQTIPKYSLKLASTNKLRVHGTRLIQSDCLSYTFFGNSFKTLTWVFNEELNIHELTKVDPKGDLVPNACRGSPVVSTQDEDRTVIGVVDCTSDGDLCLTFFSESSLEDLRVKLSVEPGEDVTDSPVSQPQSTPPVPPDREQFNEGGNNALQESRFANDNPRNNSESVTRRRPEENDTPRDLRVVLSVAPGEDVTDSPISQPQSTPPAPPDREQFNEEGNDTAQGGEATTRASAASLSRQLSHASIQETAEAEGTKFSKETTSKELKCIWDREVQTLKGFEDFLTGVLRINLDPKRSLGGDFRSLAGAFGKDMTFIWFLESAPSPTEELLKKCRPTLRFLRDRLLSKEVDRKDVAKELIAWVEQNFSCCCSNCGSSLR